MTKTLDQSETIKRLTYELRKRDDQIRELQNQNTINLRENCQSRIHRYNLTKSVKKLQREKEELKEKVEKERMKMSQLKRSLEQCKIQQQAIEKDWKEVKNRVPILIEEVEKVIKENDRLNEELNHKMNA